jgi:hypothetical protein
MHITQINTGSHLLIGIEVISQTLRNVFVCVCEREREGEILRTINYIVNFCYLT